MELKINVTENELNAILDGLLLLEHDQPDRKKITTSAYHKIFDADVETWCRKQGIEVKKMTSLSRYEVNTSKLNEETVGKIINLLQNRSKKTDFAVLTDIEYAMIDYRQAKEDLIEQYEIEEQRLEDYFVSHDVTIYQRHDKGTCIEYQTSKGPYTETFDGNLYKDAELVLAGGK